MQHLLPKIYGIVTVSFKRTKRFSNTAILVYPPNPLLGLLMSLREVPGSKVCYLLCFPHSGISDINRFCILYLVIF